MVLREHDDPLNHSKGIMGPLENSTGVQNNRGRLRQRFDLIRKLGQGTYGKVQLGIDKETGQEVAIKTIKKSKIETEADLIRIRREIQIMSSVRHPNIIHIYEVFENREKMVLVMEYAAGGELYDYLNERKVLKEDEARRIFRQIASAVYYCHKNKICHRDLKLENILLDESTNAKIADFGLSNVFDNSHLLKTFCGSPLYASPEIVRGTPYCGPEVDCWSLGVLLYTLVYGAMPFDGSNFKRLVKQISNGDYYEPKKTAEASALIKLMLTVDSLKRATIKDVCANPWINDGFDKKCLIIAEELANATPVRLDILLSLASPINASNVVIEKQADSDLPKAESSKTKLDVKPKTKAKRENGSHKPGDELEALPPLKPKTPSEVKKKQVVKKKSKSSPLLDLIVDVEEERDVEDEAGDTLSEISEIQTIAESESEFKDKLLKTKDGVSGKDTTVVTNDIEKEMKPVKVAVKITENKNETPEKPILIKPPVETVGEDKSGKAKPREPPQLNKVTPKNKVSKPVDATPVDKKLPNITTVASAQLSNESEPVVVSKPAIAVQPDVVEIKSTPGKEDKAVKTDESQKPDTKKKADVVITTEKTKADTETKDTTLETQPISEVKEVKEVVLAKDLPTQEKRSTRMKQRSDSTNSENTSPTRIERRNSKVISQKTAELIQNLETKTSTSQDKKKFVFPTLKVSDAKSRFENSGDSTLGKSVQTKLGGTDTKQGSANKETDKEKQQNGTTTLKPKLKLKSTSPSPSDITQSKQTDNPTIEPAKNEEPEPKKDTAQVPSSKVSGTPVEKPKEKVSALPPKIVSKPTSAPDQKSEQNVTKEAPSTNGHVESNTGLIVESVKSPGTKSPRRSKSPRLPEPDKVSTEQNITKPISPTNLSSKSTTKEVESAVKSVVKLKTENSSPHEQKLKSGADENVNAKPEPSKPNELPLENVETQERPPEKSLPASDSGLPNIPDSSKVHTETNEKLLTKLPPQSKEQAAKKIGSVIKKIVSSESLDKGLGSTKTSSASQNKIDSKPAAFRTEIQKFVVAPEGAKQTVNKTQRTEVTFPVAAAGSQERIIPIKLTDEFANAPSTSSVNSSATSMPRQNLQRMDSAKSSNLSFSRQNSSDTESSMSVSIAAPKQDLKKSPREFIIPIKMESSGHTVTPKDDVLNSESSITDDNFRFDSRLRSGRFGRQKKYNRLLSDSSVEDDPASASVSASTSRRSSMTTTSHARSLSQGDEPQTPGTPSRTIRRFSKNSIPLDRSDSCSSAEEDEEDAFEVLTAESLFTSLLDRVRNLTKRLNRESSAGPSWASESESPSFGLWGTNSPLQEFMGRAPSETRHFISPTPGAYSTVRSYSREPSVTVTITTRPGWRQSLSREMSGESDSVCSDAQSISGSHNAGRSYSSFRNMKDASDGTNLRSLPLHLQTSRQQYPYNSNLSEPSTATSLSSPYSSTSRPFYGRTLSNTDYSHSTLPLRRPIRAYERSYTGRDYSNNNAPLNSPAINPLPDHYSRSSSVASFRPDSLSKVEPPTPNLPLYRAFSRATSTPGPEARFNYSTSGDSTLQSGSNANVSDTNNGWVGGSTSSSTKTTAAKMTTQEKMNNYQNYYHNLNKHPTRRLDALNPAANPSLSSRPSTMYETSFMDNSNNNSTGLNRNQIFSTGNINLNREATPTMSERFIKGLTSPPIDLNVTSSIDNQSGTRSSTANSGESHGFGNSSSPLRSYEGQDQPRHEASPVGYTSVPAIRKRPPELALKQRRPISISSFGEKPVVNTDSQLQSQSQLPSNSLSDAQPSNQQICSPAELSSPSPPSFTRPMSPRSDFNFVRQETVRLTSPPPLEETKIQPPVPKLKRDVRATSVEKITRFLERKSKPRDIPPPEVKSLPTPPALENEISNVQKNEGRFSVSPEKQMKSNNTSKISKPKFLQSLEKKWEKFTNKPDDNLSHHSPSPACTTPTSEQVVSSDNSEESVVASPNESVLLQRAISPEKKPKSKFGATTVNFMLGKFRKMEETTKLPKNTNSGKPPIGISSGIGRRIQSTYAGARSDSVLVQNAASNIKTPLLNHVQCNSDDVGSRGLANAKFELSKSLAKLNRESKFHQEQTPAVENVCDPVVENKVLRRPVSLGIFSSNTDMSKSTSFIPRFNRAKSGQENTMSPALPVADLSLDLSHVLYNNEVGTDDNAITPTSDSFDSASVSSEKTEISLKSSVLDDEESVSDRIFRKSFYSRFNSLDRKKPTTSATSVAINRNNSTMRSATTCGTSSGTDTEQPGTSFSPRINKYNPNPLFKELITDEFKLNSGRKNDYSRRVTTKLSKLLSEIETDIKPSSNNLEFVETLGNLPSVIAEK